MPRTPHKGGRPVTLDWNRWDRYVGKIPDTHVAKLVGCSTHAVLKRRRKKGIRAFQPKWGG